MSVSPGAAGTKAAAIDGVMLPGLIDLHNHAAWNVLQNWQPPRVFSMRPITSRAPSNNRHSIGVLRNLFRRW